MLEAGANDISVKRNRIQAFLEREHLDALVLGRQDNFAWATCGGDNRVVTTTDMGAALAVFTADRKWLVSYTMDGQRLLDEQVRGQGFESVTVRWHEATPADAALKLTRGLRVGADSPLPGARQYEAEIVDLHYPLTDLELERCRWIGRESNRILAEVGRELRPGTTEQEIAARLLGEYALSGMTIDVLIVGADERISRYRHPLPTDKRLDRYALLHPAARRWGLHANVTRLFHFGPPPAPVQAAFDAASRVAAETMAMLAPGVPFADILARQKSVYAALGYSDEWHHHFQGGITGYTLADPSRCLNPGARAVVRQAYDYFITVTGAKFEELSLLTESGVELASMDSGWPVRTVETRCGPMTLPDMMVL
jgi:Xaa-Pro dipeptidase